MNQGNCKSCNADVYWITAKKTGNPMIVNTKRFVILTELGEMVSGFESHFSTCPFAGKHRRK